MSQNEFLSGSNIFTFVIKCNCSNDLNILSISYNYSIYPLKIRVYGEISDEVENTHSSFIGNNGMYKMLNYYNIECEEEFESILECIFNTHIIKRILCS